MTENILGGCTAPQLFALVTFFEIVVGRDPGECAPKEIIDLAKAINVNLKLWPLQKSVRGDTAQCDAWYQLLVWARAVLNAPYHGYSGTKIQRLNDAFIAFMAQKPNAGDQLRAAAARLLREPDVAHRFTRAEAERMRAALEIIDGPAAKPAERWIVVTPETGFATYSEALEAAGGDETLQPRTIMRVTVPTVRP